MATFVAASPADLKPDEMKAVTIGKKQIPLVNLNGTFYAIGNINSNYDADY